MCCLYSPGGENATTKKPHVSPKQHGRESVVQPAIEKQDPRITRTRSLILQAFERLLVEKGFHALSVQAIAEQAGINRATFYAHFADKYALLDTSIQETFQQALEKRTLNACQYSPENLHALIAVVCEFIANADANLRARKRRSSRWWRAQVKRQVQGLLRAWLEEDVSEEAKIAATAASWAIYGLGLAWSQEKKAQGLSARKQFAKKDPAADRAQLARGERKVNLVSKYLSDNSPDCHCERFLRSNLSAYLPRRLLCRGRTLLLKKLAR